MPEELGPEIYELQQSALETIQQVREELADEKASESRDATLLGRISLTTAILSALAAFASLQAGYFANEAVLGQIRASDAWQQFQAKSTKRHVEQATRTVLASFGRPVPRTVNESIRKLSDDQARIGGEARHHQADSSRAMARHESYARAVTAFQIAISLGAIAALSKRRRLWMLGLAISVFGMVSIVSASLSPSSQVPVAVPQQTSE
jgi:hypothetical protein